MLVLSACLAGSKAGTELLLFATLADRITEKTVRESLAAPLHSTSSDRQHLRRERRLQNPSSQALSPSSTRQNFWCNSTESEPSALAQQPYREGRTRLEMRFGDSLTRAYNMLVVGFFQNEISIGADRSVTTDYQLGGTS